VKTLGCYAGSTVMGDGRVALILDVQGVARHAGFSFDAAAKESAQERKSASAMDTQRVLLFKSGSEEQFAAPLSVVKRIEAVNTDNIEKIGGREFITLEGQSTLIIRPDNFLSVSPAPEKKEMFLIIPRMARQSFGVLVSQLLDTIETSVELNTESYSEDGIMGTAIIKDKMTLFLDIDSLIRKAEPAWFTRGEGGKILLVEDSPFYRKLVRSYLEADGYEVSVAENGQDGLAKLASGEFDLVISDIEMPVMDGLTFLRNLRSGNRHSDIPAIALTALTKESDRFSAQEVGFNHFVQKISRDHLLTSVETLMASAGNRN
jgi:two-component system chemotaxis sensor kinase CheA